MADRTRKATVRSRRAVRPSDMAFPLLNPRRYAEDVGEQQIVPLSRSVALLGLFNNAERFAKMQSMLSAMKTNEGCNDMSLSEFIRLCYNSDNVEQKKSAASEMSEVSSEDSSDEHRFVEAQIGSLCEETEKDVTAAPLGSSDGRKVDQEIVRKKRARLAATIGNVEEGEESIQTTRHLSSWAEKQRFLRSADWAQHKEELRVREANRLAKERRQQRPDDDAA